MRRRWMAVALLILGLCLPGRALAQGPMEGSGFRIGSQPPGAPEPTPIQSSSPGLYGNPGGPAPHNPFAGGVDHGVPGAAVPFGGPPRPGVYKKKAGELTSSPAVTLTNDGTPNAFCDDWNDHLVTNVFFSVGSIGWRRANLGSTLAATQEGTGAEIANFDDIREDYFWGVQTSFGYHYDRDLVELSLLYLPSKTLSHTVVDPGRINVAFGAVGLPAGFTGLGNNPWLTADFVEMKLMTEIFGVEGNYRWVAHTGWEWILGVRYFDVDEQFSFFTSDDGLQPLSTVFTNTTYSTRTRNQLVAPQLGLEGNWMFWDWLAVGMSYKGAVGLNFITTDLKLERGDGFLSPNGPNTRRDTTSWAHLHELSAFVDWLATERIRFRGGYQALWFSHVAEAVDQLDFNLLNTGGADRNGGSLFFHGPVLELHLAF